MPTCMRICHDISTRLTYSRISKVYLPCQDLGSQGTMIHDSTQGSEHLSSSLPAYLESLPP